MSRKSDYSSSNTKLGNDPLFLYFMFKSKYDSVEQLKKLFSHGNVVNRISLSSHKRWNSIMIELIQPKYREECLLTVFGEEAVALSGIVKSS